MRDPDKLNETEELKNNIIKIKDVPYYDINDWDLNDPKDLRQYIMTVEKCVRNSYEYKQMIDYLRDNLHMNQCSFLENVSNSDYSRVRIEIHHDPLSLFDIAGIVTRKRIFFAESLDEEMTAKEIMLDHFHLLIGLIPLSETVHELVHNRFLFIPTNKIFGNYKQFVELYRDFILPEQLEYLNNIEEATACYNDSQYKEILEKKYIYLDINDGKNLLPTTEDIKKLVSNRMELLDKPVEENKQDPKVKTLYVKVDKTDKTSK